ncbi:Cobalamin synthesis protein/P47K [alpha proteobacterium BAL199]|jgi:G3E family GTPase|nr:Cobalamin synthesis protein/P47K [alpha proteobacterium BAL199]
MAGTGFHILCGFLGSGKTTLLLDYLALPEAADTAVLVNDVGMIDVDGVVVAGAASGMPVAMLSNGCVCCSIGNELVVTIGNLVHDRQEAGLPPFRRMILECSGLSRPGPIIRSLADLGAHDFRVRVMATFDAGQGADHAAHFEEAAAQLAAAQSVVLTKLDLLGSPSVQDGVAAVHALNPLAHVVAEPDRRARALAAFAGRGPALETLAEPETIGGLRAMRHPRIGVFLASLPPDRDWDAVALWIEDLAARCGERLLRVKGLVRVAGIDGAVLVQAVGTIFSPPLRMPPGTGGTPGAVVVIVQDLGATELNEVCEPHGVALVET